MATVEVGAQVAAARPVTVSATTDLGEIRALATEWAVVRDGSASRNPFAGPEWTIPWYEHFAHGTVSPLLLTVRDGDELVGIVPLCHQAWSGGVSRMAPAGGVRPWIGPYELPGPVALTGHERTVGRLAVEHLCTRSEEWTWAELSLGDMVAWFEPTWVPDDGFVVVPRGNVCTVVLPLQHSAEFKPRRNLKEALRRARNRLTRDFGEGWAVRRVVEPELVGAAVTRLIGLHRARSRRTDKGAVHADVLSPAPVRAFLQSATARLAEAGLVSVYELVAAGTVIASQLVLHTPRSTHMSVSGMSDAAWEYSAITYLQGVAVDDAQAACHDLVDFSAGPTEAKLRWSQEIRVHPRVVVVPPRPAARAVYRTATVVRAYAEFERERNANRRSHPHRWQRTRE